MNPLSYIGPWDWAVLSLYIIISSLLGNMFRKQQKSPKDFFLGGKNVPWPAVSASFVATAISAISFVGVPAMVYAKNGNFTYLQFFIGALLARIALAYLLLPQYYKTDIYSPYDYLEKKLGHGMGKITSILFFMGAVLGQGVRVYATGIVLEVMTGFSLAACIAFIAIFSIFWTWLGGIQAVIWTDVLQFSIFIVGGGFTLFFIVHQLPYSFSEILSMANTAGKTQVFNFNFDLKVPFTFWAALIAIPFQNLAAFGTDQLITQRLLCCKNIKSAQKAVLWSTLGELITLLMLVIGSFLFIYYQNNPMNEGFAHLVLEKSDRVFPIFILTELPTGLKGLLLAGIFAAANSSMDSVLAALSQISVTTFYQKYFNTNASNKDIMRVSRFFIIFWGVILSVMAYLCSYSKDTLVHLAFTMTSYTYGPMLGFFLLAIFYPKVKMSRLWVSTGIGVTVILLIQNTKFLNQLFNLQLPDKIMAWPWLFPLGSLIIFVLTIIPKPKTHD